MQSPVRVLSRWNIMQMNDKAGHNEVFFPCQQQQLQGQLEPLLLTWINFSPSVEK